VKARTLRLSIALLVSGGLWFASCQGCGETEPAEGARTVPWEGSWPVVVLTHTNLDQSLDPLQAYSDMWLQEPSRNGAKTWPDPWTLEQRFAGDSASARIGRARALFQSAAAYEALGLLDAEALCSLGRHPGAFGDAVPTGYLFGTEGCLWAGDHEGALAAWGHWERFSATTRAELPSWDWPAPPPEDPGIYPEGRALPVSGWKDARPGADSRRGPPGVAFRTTYHSRDQDVEYAFVLPTDLHAAAAELRAMGQEALDGCADCPSDAAAVLGGELDPAGPSCALAADAALPLVVGSGTLSLALACAKGDGPPRYDGPQQREVSALDEEAEAYLVAYSSTVRAEAVGAGLAVEAMPTVKSFSRRAVYRRLGLDATERGDNAAALWALETGAGADWSTAPRGANDPEMLCSLSLARLRAGRYRSVIETLDRAGEEEGWQMLVELARTVARVETLPGNESVGVMR